MVLAAAYLCAGTLALHAQEQEKKLLDRLLKPDMALQNEAQNKQFTAGGAIISKKARTKSFYIADRRPERGFWDTRQVSGKEFRTRKSRHADEEADLRTRTKISKIDSAYPVPGYPVRIAHDANKSAPVSDYAGARPFRGRGKSQKSLDQKNPPLTIDQVRELLNKNK